PTHRLAVDLTEDAQAPHGERPTVLVTEHLDRELMSRDDPVEHVLEGSSPAYRAQRLRIVERAYDVRSGLPDPADGTIVSGP
ncbi:MAG: hypothetical protein M3P04_13085, partial [Actinomycetota bacterium]|nr:hypothetical protein [Actinomycetota bacterium]